MLKLSFLPCTSPNSPVRGISQARILEWVATSFSRGSFWPRDRTHVSFISCTGRRILYHGATWEAPVNALKSVKSVFSSVQSLSRVWLFATHGLQHSRLPCPSPTPGACSNSCPSSWWCHPTILFSVVPFSSCLQSFPSSESFPVSQLFTSGVQSTGSPHHVPWC